MPYVTVQAFCFSNAVVPYVDTGVLLLSLCSMKALSVEIGTSPISSRTDSGTFGGGYGNPRRKGGAKKVTR